MAKQKQPSTVVAVAVKKAEVAVAINEVAADVALAAELNDMATSFGPMIRVRRELLRIPRLKLTQAMSKANNAGLARPGEFVSDVKGKAYGTEIEIIPVLISESASLMSKEAAQVVCSTRDLIKNLNGEPCSKCPHGEYWNDWGTKDQKKTPGCKHSIDMIVLLKGDPIPAEINFRKNNQKAGKALINFIANDFKRVPFASKYKLRSSPKTSGQYNFFAIDEYIEKTVLSDAEIKEIIPSVRKILDMEKSGSLEREAEDVADDTSDDLPV